ncbi:MAG: DUF4215 domain-containing protein [Deltaproteobacteria bacterium]|nr:DUF4215 domain-containing protein [Deltaproteobacteria bacterium]
MNRFVFFAALLLLLSSCTEKDLMNKSSGEDSSDVFGTDSADTATDTLKGVSSDSTKCGNSVLTDDEACDDGNTKSGDGCTKDCLAVEVGYSCNPPGEACRQIAKCGDGLLVLPELCDDGNKDDGDGCSSACRIEQGYECDDESPNSCKPTNCGDGKITGTESCDDGNNIPFDGCSVDCVKEPDCSDSGCSSNCGDGFLLNEECDDGNTSDGDGCSSMCKIEKGFTCKPETPCEMIDGKCILRVSAVFRDFSTSTDSFGDFEGGGNVVTDLLESKLVDGKPVLTADGASRCSAINSPESFARWYTDGDERETLVSSLILYDNDADAYVNRWGKNGEQWCVSDNAIETCYDGTPVFFPVDELAGDGDRREATIPPEYGGGWQAESNFIDGATTHNFGFTSEVMYWFRYDDKADATLTFLGDDDLWVFINGQLVLDLGCVHTPLEASVTLDADKAKELNLIAGNVYSIKVFHAERNPTGSSFKLTLAGFDSTRSLCLPNCGDGLVGLGEECDDGENDGGYGECYPGCILGAYCGDGIVQTNEDCDDGNTIENDGCGSSCRQLSID